MLKRVAALMLLMCLIASSALADATPTPPPVEIGQEVLEPPALIRNALDIAYHEWEELGGKSLPNSNKYTKWRNNYEWGWCNGFITWCMLEAGVPMDDPKDIETAGKESADGFVSVEGVHYSKESSVGSLLPNFQRMNRTTMVPQPGFLLVYGASYSGYIHVGLVYDVQALGDGKYRITTIEGNMSHTVKMFIHDYDMYAADKQKNLSVVPENERVLEAAKNLDYKIAQGTVGGKKHHFYVNYFLMPWVPGDPLNELTTPTPPAN